MFCLRLRTSRWTLWHVFASMWDLLWSLGFVDSRKASTRCRKTRLEAWRRHAWNWDFDPRLLPARQARLAHRFYLTRPSVVLQHGSARRRRSRQATTSLTRRLQTPAKSKSRGQAVPERRQQWCTESARPQRSCVSRCHIRGVHRQTLACAGLAPRTRNV